MNPFDLNGPSFLAFFGVMAAVGIAVGFIVRWLMRLPGGEPNEECSDLSAFEIAYLNGGTRCAVNAAVASLVRRGLVNLSARKGTLRVISSQEIPKGLDALERRIYREIEKQSRFPFSDAVRFADSTIGRMRSKLDELGLTLDAVHRLWACAIPTLIMAVIVTMGVVKLDIGLQRERPIGFLVVGLIATVIVSLIAFCRPPLRSRRGDRLLARLRDEHRALETTMHHNAEGLATNDLMMATALFGFGFLTFGPFSNWHSATHTTSSVNNYWGGDGGGCGGGCGAGDGCGGGGGCGGGCGCGGCGG